MNIATTDCSPASGSPAELLSTSSQQLGVNASSPDNSSATPSPFELLFLQQMGRTGSADFADQGDFTSTVIGATYKSDLNEAHTFRQKPTTSDDSPAAIGLMPVYSPTVSFTIASKLAGGSSAYSTAQVTGNSNPLRGLGAPAKIADDLNASANAFKSDQSSSPSKPDSGFPIDSKIDGNQPLETTSDSVDVAVSDDFPPSQTSTSLPANGQFTDLIPASAAISQTTSSVIAELTNSQLGSASLSTSARLSNSFRDNSIGPVVTEIIAGTNASSSRKVDSADTPLRAFQIDDHLSLEAIESTVIPMQSATSAFSGVAGGMISDQIAGVVTQQIDDEGLQGPTTIRIRLNREDLGTVNLHLSMSNNVVSIKIVTENPLAQQVISGQMDDLRQSLANDGITAGQFDVACNTNGQGLDDHNSSTPVPDQIMPAGSTRSTRVPTVTPIVTRSAGKLNFVA